MGNYLRPLAVRGTGATFVSLLVLGTLLAALTLRAQQAPSPNPDFVDALWVAKFDQILKVAATDGTLLFDIPDAQNVVAVAVDEQRGVLWAYGKSTLRAYNFNGTPLLSIPVPPTADEQGDFAVLSVNPNNGTVWLGVSKTLRHFTVQGQLLTTIPLSHDIRALAFDHTAARLWVATQKSVSAYDDAGMVVQSLNLGRNPDVKDLALRDPELGELWVALKDTLRRYAADGTLLSQISLKGVAHIASDGQGGVWAATNTSLMRLNQAGTMLVQLNQFRDENMIVALAADPVDGSVWAAAEKTLWHIDADGQPLQTLAFQSGPPIHDLALYADTASPVLTITAPVEGALLNTNTPSIDLSYSDTGIGVDVGTLVIANSSELDVTCVFDETSASCTPTTPLPEGPITLSATIEDFAGNMSERAEVSFTIDTTPPDIAFTAPVNGAVLDTALPTIAVS